MLSAENKDENDFGFSRSSELTKENSFRLFFKPENQDMYRV